MCHLLKISLALPALGVLQALPAGEPEFYLAGNAKYTIVRSALVLASVTFNHCLVELRRGTSPGS